MDKKQEAIELLKKETTDLANLYKKDGGFVLSGTYKTEKEGIGPGDYFIARRPKNTIKRPAWNNDMDKYDGVIQKCEEISFLGDITVSGVEWVFDPEWCEKVSPGDVMKTGYGDLIIFKEFKNGKMYDYALFSQPQLHISHTTPEEAKPLFDALAKSGKKWNKEKLQIEDIKWEPKAGDVCVNKYGYIFIYKREPLISTDGFIEFYAALYQDISIFVVNGMALCDEIRLAAYEERCMFFERLVKEGYKWDAKKLKLTRVEKKHKEEKWEQNIDICISTHTSGTTLSHMAELCDKPTVDERNILNQMIKLCKQLLNEK